MKNRQLLSAIAVAGALFGTLTACSQNDASQNTVTYATSKKVTTHTKKNKKTNKTF